MPPFKCLHWTRLLHVCCVYGILLLPQISKVWGACRTGYEISCIWTHDEKTTLRWVSAKESGENFVRLTGCPSECGTAVMRSPWLEPREEDSVVVLHYKLYGTSNVYLRLYLKPEDGTSQLTLFSKEGNYKFPFPNEWTTKKVTIPATPTRHRLLLKAQIPYAEAYVSVKGLNLDGNIPIESTSPRPTTTESPEEGDITTTLCTTEEDENFSDPTDFPDYEEETEENEIGKYQEEDGYREVEEIMNGYTRIMDPNICKFRKPKRMKWK